MSLEFLMTALIIVLMPGTGALYTIAMGLTEGRKASLLAAIGCTIGIVPHMTAAILGLAAVLASSDAAFNIVRIAGVCYLIWMAIGMLRQSGQPAAAAGASQTTALAIMFRAVMINLLNPKLSLFFLAFLPQFVDQGAPDAIAQMLVDSAVFMGLTLVVFALYGLFAAAMRSHVLERPATLKWINRVFASAFLAMAAKLALAQK